MNQEEIQKRIEAANAIREERLAPYKAERAAQKEATKWLAENEVLLDYTEVPYAVRTPYKKPKMVQNMARISSAIQKVAIVDDVCKLKIAYAVMSPKDNFSRPAVRKLLADRLQSGNSQYVIELDASISCVDDNDKLYSILAHAMTLQLLSKLETFPTWLQKGLLLNDEADDSDFDPEYI